MALACSLIIAAVTFVISFTGLILGTKCGTKFSNKATILGGAILIAIGIEIFVSGVFQIVSDTRKQIFYHFSGIL